ncbi:autotransporter outer membrane beta-barrel domain-containing protein [Bosea sp. (in: a-proteobacteria)]|uniref:autotransporter outer membrane beta-barrel domain-containing protein n=1 Tax=Bosea sp. (in: a-proteobacteria) TaxID=1871050 RepID=UPI0027334DB4|nr:autotransporter outer membrane beta-barrel domain-containing protein [Bosea sp. (in: a-proteobacteria)]MDP3408147.1 autotransporter outer membrane beta-barrel domain-containing protein [Bosea sp. (in: a-proteobacteria)]
MCRRGSYGFRPGFPRFQRPICLPPTAKPGPKRPGPRPAAQLLLAGKPLKLEAGAAWIRNGNTGTSALASFQTLPGASFSVGGTALDRNALRTTASAELKLTDAIVLATSLEGEFAQNSRSFGGKAALRYQW